ADQQKILNSWGGADLLIEWYDNANKAGAVPQQFQGWGQSQQQQGNQTEPTPGNKRDEGPGGRGRNQEGGHRGHQAAVRYFNHFSPDDQARIIASWGGQNRLDEWYANAVKAGDTGAVQAGSANYGDIQKRAQWAHDNIDSGISVAQWAAWDQFYD